MLVPNLAKMEVIREYAGRIEYLAEYDHILGNVEEAMTLAMVKGGYVQISSESEAVIIYEAAGRTYFTDDIGDTSWYGED